MTYYYTIKGADMADGKGYSEFRTGWPVVLAAMLGIGLGLSPVPFYSIGMLAPELATRGWFRDSDLACPAAPQWDPRTVE